MTKEEFLKLSDLDKVKYAIEESLKEHKGYKSEYWKGSAFMGESILQTIEQVKKFTVPDVSQQREVLLDFIEKYNKGLVGNERIHEDSLEEYLQGNL